MKTHVLVLICFIVGLGAGLAYAWLIEPVTFTESSPAQVMKAYREAWLLMTAEAYAQDGDWERTQARLNSLHDANLGQTVVDLFERYRGGGPNVAARALARLADRLNVRTPAMLVYLAAIETPSEPTPASNITGTAAPSPMATLTPTATPEPPPTLTPTATIIPDYQVIDRRAECTTGKAPPQIRVIVQDLSGQSDSGKEVWVTWDGGADRFVTGFKPEIDPGYGDFDMQLDQSYNVSIDKPTSVVVSDLRADPCDTDGHTSWRLIIGPRIP